MEIRVEGVTDWLASDIPAWATAVRHNANMVEREGTLILTARNMTGDVGYAIFDKPMSHLHYIETRKDCRRQGVAASLWERVQREAVHDVITATGDSEEGMARLVAWGFDEGDGMWTWRRPTAPAD